MPFPFFVFVIIGWVVVVSGPDLNLSSITLREIGSFVFGVSAGLSVAAWAVELRRSRQPKTI